MLIADALVVKRVPPPSHVIVEPAGLATPGNSNGARVRVSDDGCGLKPDYKLGLGLTGMRERILALGGSLTVASGGTGVTVEALIPQQAA